MRSLVQYEDYTREDVHDIFDPNSAFTPSSGTWGISGIIRVPERPGDFVFFVTFGQIIGAHAFDEGITASGVLSWESQPQQDFQDQRIRELIAHMKPEIRFTYFCEVARAGLTLISGG